MKKNILLIIIMMAMANVSLAGWFGVGLGSYTLKDNTKNYTWEATHTTTKETTTHVLDTSKDPGSGLGFRFSYGMEWFDSTSIEFVLHSISKTANLIDCSTLLGSTCSVNLKTSLTVIGAIAVQSFQLGESSGIFVGGGLGYSMYTKELVIEAAGYEEEELQKDTESTVSGIARVGVYFAENWEVSLDYIGPYGNKDTIGAGSTIGLGVNYNFYVN